MSVRGDETDPDTQACFKAQPPCVPEAGSQRALSHPCLPFSSLQLGSVFPWLWCALFGEDRIKTKARGSAPTWLLLALGSCLCSLWPYPGIQDAACPGKGGRRIVPWALLFGRGVKALPYHCFPGFPVFPKVPVLPGGSPISRLVPGFPKVGAKEAEGAQGQPRWRH